MRNEKQIFTKTQAIAVFQQLKVNRNSEVNLLLAVEKNNSMYKLSCEDLEKKLLNYLDSAMLAGVVDDPIFGESNPA